MVSYQPEATNVSHGKQQDLVRDSQALALGTGEGLCFGLSVRFQCCTSNVGARAADVGLATGTSRGRQCHALQHSRCCPDGRVEFFCSDRLRPAPGQARGLLACVSPVQLVAYVHHARLPACRVIKRLHASCLSVAHTCICFIGAVHLPALKRIHPCICFVALMCRGVADAP